MYASHCQARRADFIDPSKPSKCTWQLGTTEESPHIHRPMHEIPKNCNNILEAIGGTPMVRLNKIPQCEGIKCEMYAKCEFMNPTGSVKDRTALRMIKDVEGRGLIKPGYTIIEPASGNTGIGLALICAVKGYKCQIVTPDKMSNETESTLRLLGADVVRTPTEVHHASPESMYKVSQQLQHEIPNSIMLNEFRNPSNPLAHYDCTASEILMQLDGNVDMIVAGVDTGGTITGIGRRIKELKPNCKIIGVDPYGSQVARPEVLNATTMDNFLLEGIGSQFVPTVMDHRVVDAWDKVSDKNSFSMSRRLAAEEGLLCGGAGGAIMTVALKFAKNLEEGQRCVVILPDGIRNYMTKFISDNWMEARGFKDLVNKHNHSWWNLPVRELKLSNQSIVTSKAAIGDVISILKRKNIEEIVMVDADYGQILGVIEQDKLIQQMVSLNRQAHNNATYALNTKVIRLTSADCLGKLARILELDNSVLIVDRKDEKQVLRGLANKKTILEYIANDCRCKLPIDRCQ